MSLRERLTQWIVSQRIDDYLWRSRAAHCSTSRAAVFNASSRSIWLDFAIFHPARFAALVRYTDIQRNGASAWSHRRCSAIQAR